MAEIAQTPAAAQSAAQQVIKQREDGIRAQAIKQGRELERQSIALERAKEAAQHAGEVAGILKAQAEEIARLEAQQAATSKRAFGHGFWRGGAALGIAGLLVGIGVGIVAYDRAAEGSFQSAGEYGSRMVATGAAQQMANPPTPCIPGQRLDDGRRCPNPDLEARTATGDQP